MQHLLLAFHDAHGDEVVGVPVRGLDAAYPLAAVGQHATVFVPEAALGKADIIGDPDQPILIRHAECMLSNTLHATPFYSSIKLSNFGKTIDHV